MTAPDLAVLIERLNEVNRLLYAHGAITITVKDVGKRGSLATEAAAALAELQADNERLAKRGQKYRDDWERAEAEVARLTETPTHITWDAQGRRLVNGRFGHEHSAPTVNVQLSGDAEYWKERAERAEARANELEQARESIEEFSHMKTDRIAALEAERDALTKDAARYQAAVDLGLLDPDELDEALSDVSGIITDAARMGGTT